MNKKILIAIMACLSLAPLWLQAQELTPIQNPQTKKWGFVDESGKEVIPFIYDYALDFSEGLAVVNKRGHEQQVHEFDINGEKKLVTRFIGGKWGYVDKTGKEVIPLKYGGAESFSEGFARIRSRIVFYQYIDKTGNVVIPFRYVNAMNFSEGLATVSGQAKIRRMKPPKQHLYRLLYRWGVIDQIGNVIIPLKYEEPIAFSNGMAAVKLDDKYGYFDDAGNEIIPCKYDTAFHFSEKYAIVKLDGKWGIVDKTGQEIAPCKYDAFWLTVPDYEFEINSQNIIIKKADETNSQKGSIFSHENLPEILTVIEALPENLFVYFMDTFHENYHTLKNSNAFYVRFIDGLTGVKSAGKWGYIDETGKEVIPCQYDEISQFTDGVAEVVLNGETIKIDKEGNKVE